ncbi:MAG: BatA and WFA domain-containing protein [Dictyoglomus sp.]|nr:BatA and WFA domain-containing protein [Dictyoglomus sp.]MCX7942795.1 BatA and WFA domain-containing protein [Dictyoglomaceae bacterium]MDW8188397.1 BatA and WFA domain-containing protein [Dictyoglomus sp.]
MSINFTNPHFLWLLSLVSIIIILHLIRPRRITVTISSLILWEKIFKENPTGKWFKKLPKNILLYLQILALILLVLSLAQPQIIFKGDINSPVILVIDCSASLASRDILPSRFENVKIEALKILKKIPFWRPVALIIIGKKPEIVSSFTIRHNLIEKNIKALRVLYTRNNIESAIELCESLLPNTPKEIHIFSDGNAKFSFPSNSINNYYVHIIGKDGNNVGITRAEIIPKNNKIAELFVEISNFSENLKEFPLEIWNDNKLWTTTKIIIKPKEIKNLIFEVPYISQKLLIKLRLKDQLEEDNNAYLFLPVFKFKILLVSPGNPFLEKALRAIPNTYIDIKRYITQEDFLDYDFIVFDRLIPEYVPAGNYLFIGSAPKNFDFEVTGKITKTKIISWEDVPIMNLIYPLNVNIFSSLILKSSDFKPLLYCEKGPIGFIYEKKDIFSVILPFSILDTDWYLYDSFPIFIYNIIKQALSYNFKISAGETVLIRDGSPIYTIKTPKEEREHENKIGIIEFNNTFDLGFYIIKSRNKERVFTVNMFSREESDIKPKFMLNNNIKTEIKEKGLINLSLTPYLLFLCFFIFLIEIIIFLGGLKFK